MALLLFALWAAALGLQIVDYVATVQALSHGYVEGNPVMRWLFSKLGHPATTFLGAALSSVAFALWTAYWPVAGVVFAAIVVGLLSILMLPRSIKLLKQYGLK